MASISDEGRRAAINSHQRAEQQAADYKRAQAAREAAEIADHWRWLEVTLRAQATEEVLRQLPGVSLEPSEWGDVHDLARAHNGPGLAATVVIAGVTLEAWLYCWPATGGRPRANPSTNVKVCFPDGSKWEYLSWSNFGRALAQLPHDREGGA